MLGATGVYGRHLVPRLIGAGYRGASARAPARDGALSAAACGAGPAAADLFDEASLRAGLAGCSAAINLATALPTPTSRGGLCGERSLSAARGSPIFVRACRAAGVARIVQQSIAMVHAGGGDAWAERDHLPQAWGQAVAAAAIAAARAMEAVDRNVRVSIG